MATQPGPWEDFQQAPPVAAPVERRGRPRLPPPQTGTQAALDRQRLLDLIDDRNRQNRQAPQADTGGVNFDSEERLRSAYQRLPEVQNYQNVVPMLQAATRAGNGGAGDLQIVYAFAKAMDPGSVVREGEVQMSQDTGGVGDRIRGYIQSLRNGRRLTADVRAGLIAEIQNRVGSYRAAYNQTRKDYWQRAERYNFDPESIVGRDIDSAYGGEAAPAVASAAAALRDVNLPFVPDPTIPPPPLPATNAPGEITRTDPREGAQALDQAVEGTPDPLTGQAQNPRFLTDDDRLYHREWVARVRAGWDRDRLSEWSRSRHRNEVDDATWNMIEESRRTGRGVNWQPVPTGMNIDEYRSQSEARQGAEDREQWAEEHPIQAGIDSGVRSAANVATLGLADPIAARLSGTSTAYEHGVTNADWRDRPVPAGIGSLVGGGMSGRYLPFGSTAPRQFLAGAGYSGVDAFNSADGSVEQRLRSAIPATILGGPMASAFGIPARRAAQQNAFDPIVDPVTLRLNSVLENATPAERVQAAREFGIDMPLGAATDRGGRIIEAGLDNYPFSAGVMNDARRVAAGQVDTAVENLGARRGSARSLNEGGAELQNSARSWIDRAQGVRGDADDGGVIGRAYDAIPIRPETPAQTPNALTRLRELNARFSESAELAEELNNPAFQRFQTALERGNLSWQSLKDFRSEIGERIGERRFGEKGGLSQYRALYAALSEDMRATAASISPSALRRFERANSLNAAVEDRIQNGLTQILGSNGRMEPEQAARRVQEIIRSGRGSSNLRLLRDIHASTARGGGWDEIAGMTIRLMGQPANSQGRSFDPAAFVRSYADMSEDARALLFGGQNRQLRQELDRFVAVSQRLWSRDALRTSSPTGPILSGVGTVATIGNDITSLAIPGASAFALSKLWTNPGFVQWATGYNRMVARAARTGSTPTQRQIARQRSFLGDWERRNSGVASSLGVTEALDRLREGLFPEEN